MEGRHLKMIVSERGGLVEITLSGFISERATMDAEEIAADRRVVIDSGGVLSINSYGVRTWVNFIEALCGKSKEVLVKRLPPVLVQQASMVPNFLGKAKVDSFFTPWCCLECGHETLSLQSIDDVVPKSGDCPECAGETEFDDIRESYLAFRDN